MHDCKLVQVKMFLTLLSCAFSSHLTSYRHSSSSNWSSYPHDARWQRSLCLEEGLYHTVSLPQLPPGAASEAAAPAFCLLHRRPGFFFFFFFFFMLNSHNSIAIVPIDMKLGIYTSFIPSLYRDLSTNSFVNQFTTGVPISIGPIYVLVYNLSISN